MLQVLSFPRPVSIDNFRRPNFPLVAEILHWLVLRVDPSFELSFKIDTEAERVLFIRTVVQHLAVKANIRLNTKKLYEADGRAVQELVKEVKVMYEASQSTHSSDDENDDTLNVQLLRSKLSEFKRCRELASEITSRGANLYDALEKEIELREQRLFVLTRPLNLHDVDEGLKESVQQLQREMHDISQKMENIAVDEGSLDAKIEKRKEDLERTRKRLDALKSVRPAFMDEYEKLEQELSYVYDLYVLKYRCLTFLEQQLEDIEKTELDQIQKREENIRGMISNAMEKSLFEEDKYGNGLDAESSQETDEDGSQLAEQKAIEKKNLSKRMLTGKITVHGSIPLNDDSMESDLDLEGEEASDLDSEDELELMNLAASRDKSAPKNVSKKPDSDDDF
jgi:clusterin-associated protein 1